MPKRIILEGIITDKINNILLLLLFKKSENINDIPILWIVAAIIVPIVHVLLNTVLYNSYIQDVKMQNLMKK